MAMPAMLLLIVSSLHYELISCTVYVDHVSRETGIVEILPGDALYSLDNNTRSYMLSNGNFVLQSRTDSSSSWIIRWQTGTYSDVITSGSPAFVVQGDRNLVVYTPAECNVCRSWQSDTAISCCSTYHLLPS